MARTSGSSRRDAREALETAAALDDCPQVSAALAAGELSLTQAAHITKATAACPGAETELVALSRRAGLGTLVERARALRLGTLDPEDPHTARQEARHLRHWRDELGMVCLAGALAPEVGLGVVRRLEAEAQRLGRRARAEGRHETQPAHAADALVALVSGSGGARGGRGAEVVLVCDVSAYRRGHAEGGETCHLVGGGRSRRRWPGPWPPTPSSRRWCTTGSGSIRWRI